MKVRVLVFGILKDWLGSAETVMELPEGATVAVLLERLSASQPMPIAASIAVSVNAEFAVASDVLRDGDEVGPS